MTEFVEQGHHVVVLHPAAGEGAGETSPDSVAAAVVESMSSLIAPSTVTLGVVVRLPVAAGGGG